MTDGPTLRRSADLVLVISDLGSGGAQRVLTTLANHWARAGRSIAAVTFSPESSDFFRLESSIQRICLGGFRESVSPLAGLVANLRRTGALRGAIRSIDAPTVVAFVAATNILVILATIGLGRRVVVCERNDPARQSLGRIWDWLRRRLYCWADVVTANTQGALAAMKGFVPEAKLVRLPNPPAQTNSVANGTSKERMILGVGRLHRQKAYDVLLKAFARITPDWRLVLVGEGECRAELEALATSLGISGRVDFAGRVADPAPYYQAAQIFALPSRYEGMPNALLEAMNFGLAPVVSDGSSGPLEMVNDEESGLVVGVEDVPALANALSRLIEDEELRLRIGQAARMRAGREEFNHSVVEWERVLELGGAPSG